MSAANGQSVRSLLATLVDHWVLWEEYENFYLETLLPQLMSDPTTGDEDEQAVLTTLRESLSGAEWKILPDLIKEHRNGVAREFEREKERRAEKASAHADEIMKAANARIAAFEKARKEDLKCRELQEQFNSSFLNAESFFRNELAEHVSESAYLRERTKFVQTWAVKHLDGLELDSNQAAAVGEAFRHAQVVARAGSGKTRSIVAWAAFLQKHCGVPAGNILLLAFNRSAAKQMRDRLRSYLGENVPHVMTFHALAYGLVHPEKVPLYDEPQGAQTKSRLLQEIIDEFVRDPGSHDQIRDLMLAHFSGDWEQICKGGYELGRDDMLRFRRSLRDETLKGDYVKSFGEKRIADFLFEHGIDYDYEKNFWWKGRNYRPDFTISLGRKKGVVVEYFGLQGDAEYDKETASKIKFWRTQTDWSLLSLTPAQVAAISKEEFETIIGTQLTGKGIKCVRLSEDEIWERIRDRAIGRYTRATVNFIQRCRKLMLRPADLTEKIANHRVAERSETLFLRLAVEVYEAYLEKLAKSGADDFDGLIQTAANCVREGHTVFERKDGTGDMSKMQFVGIDEYQDFSLLFDNLITAVREKNAQTKYFCVGDDWQAINGFAGSDLKFFEGFSEKFSPHRHFSIPINYRSAQEIVATGNAAMRGLGEPANAASEEVGTVVRAHLSEFEPSGDELTQFSGDDLTPALLRLANEYLPRGQKMILLSRKNSLPYYVNYGRQFRSFGDSNLDRLLQIIRSFLPEKLRDSISISTTHKFKGGERNIVVILDAIESCYPLIHPDMVFTRVLGDDLSTIIAEERRLFYVALTRAESRLIIITAPSKPSPFLADIESVKSIGQLDWSKYEPFAGSAEHVQVSIRNQEYAGNAGTFPIKGLLRKADFSWVASEKSWVKLYMESTFDLRGFQEDSTWARHADKVEVSIRNGGAGGKVSEYLIDEGKWRPKR